jgi:hypothetical protein
MASNTTGGDKIASAGKMSEAMESCSLDGVVKSMTV